MNKKKRTPIFTVKRQKASMIALKTGLPIISAALITLAIKLQNARELDSPTVLSTYPDMFSFVLSSLALLLAGAMFLDFIEKKAER